MQGFRPRELHPILLQSNCQCPEPESVRSPKNNDRDRLRCISQPLPCRLCGSVPVASDFNRRNLECRVGDRLAVGRIGALKSKWGDRISALRHINCGCTVWDGESGVGSRESGVGELLTLTLSFPSNRKPYQSAIEFPFCVKVRWNFRFARQRASTSPKYKPTTRH